MELLAFIGLADYADMPAGELSGGQRRLLALGRAMAMKPKLLMLDEPAAGLSPVNVDILLDTVLALQESLRAHRRHHRAHPEGGDGDLRDGQRARARREDRRRLAGTRSRTTIA